MSRAFSLVPVAAVFALSAGLLALRVPFDLAPDEWSQMHYVVAFIAREGRLPVAGRDDASAYATAHPSPTGRLVARYSYANTPALSALPYAALARAGPALGVDPVRAARLASLSFGLLALAATWGACRALCVPPAAAASAAALLASVPQVQFAAAYVNQDAFALAATALLAWSLACDLRRGSAVSAGIAGLALGAVLVAKLNAWASLPFAVLGLLLRRTTPARAVSATCGALFVAGFWLLRNAFLYGSPTGQGRVLELMSAAQGPGDAGGCSVGGLLGVGRTPFLSRSLQSLVMTFGYMDLRLPRFAYAAIAAAVLLSLVVVLGTLVRARDTSGLAWAGGVASLWGVVLLLSAWNSACLDYQPQGRYLLPALVPTAIALGVLAARHRSIRFAVLALVGMFAVASVWAHVVVSQAYAGWDPHDVAAVRWQALAGGASEPLIAGPLTSERAGLRGVRFEPCRPRAYDVAFYGLELRDESGRVIRTAFVLPADWRAGARPAFRFRPVADSAGRHYGVSVFAGQAGARALCVANPTPRAVY